MAIVIEKKIEQGNVELSVSGKLDTVAAPELEAALDEVLSDTENLILNLSGLDYIASSGLRVVLRAQKAMKEQGTMKLINVGETVKEVFDITGFTGFLTIE